MGRRVAIRQFLASRTVERDVRRLSAIDRAVGADRNAGVFGIHEVERQPIGAVHFAR